MILLIDNYDSFVFNLARYFEELGQPTRVVRNDAVSVDQVSAMRPEAIVLSPGPCTPREAGISLDLVRKLAGKVPMLGVCLGHQAICAAFGAEIVRAAEPVHGRTSLIEHGGGGLFAGLPSPLRATRYHSLVVDEATLPPELVLTARTTDGVPMAVASDEQRVYGVQFHPESVLTDSGHMLLGNFLLLSGLSAEPVLHEEAPLPALVSDWNTAELLDGRTLHW
ncbi:MAG: aminodeoxychorismate/anthranilate synthase component II [Planctomycetes bacterium]|nr:aminodeoxychorismate/anthranilate synthase component II [Planctomycetota bacterium]